MSRTQPYPNFKHSYFPILSISLPFVFNFVPSSFSFVLCSIFFPRIKFNSSSQKEDHFRFHTTIEKRYVFPAYIYVCCIKMLQLCSCSGFYHFVLLGFCCFKLSFGYSSGGLKWMIYLGGKLQQYSVVLVAARLISLDNTRLTILA